MYQLEVLRNQLIVMALGSGVVLVALAATIYQAYYKPRPDEFPSDEKPSTPLESLRAAPWFLIITYIASALMAVVGLWITHVHPLNW